MSLKEKGIKQVNSVIDAINTALSTNIAHIGA